MKVEIIERNGIRATLIHGDCFAVRDELPPFNCVITDPPFSARTHAGHDQGARQAIRAESDICRRELSYSAWGDFECEHFCQAYSPDGWMAVLTDHILAMSFEAHMSALGRYTFAPLPNFTPGRSVRLTGDGPSSWTDWIVVSRTKAQIKWGTLPGGYVNAAGNNRGADKSSHMGGKPIGLMLNLVNDYSREGDTVCDPCMGAGTTGIACLKTGRHFIGIERDGATFNMAVKRIKAEADQCVFATARAENFQPAFNLPNEKPGAKE